MMDPLSIIAGVIGIATAAIQSSKVLFELVNDIKGGPEEIRFVSRDLHAFYAVVFALNATLKDIDVKNVITCEETMVNMIGNLAGPLENCQVVLGELMVKIQQLVKPCSEGKGLRMTSIKWGWSSKNEVKKLRLRLEATKSTLGNALNTITTTCSMRLLAASTKVATARPVHWPIGSTDATFAISSFVSDPQLSSRIPCGQFRRERATANADTEAPSRSNEQVSDYFTSFVHETHYAVMLGNRSLLYRLSQIYRDLGEQLKVAMEQSREIKDERTTRTSNHDANLPRTLVHRLSECDAADQRDSSAIDVLLDCVSRFSVDDFSSSINRLHAKFSGSPDYILELTNSFYPEQYSTESLFSDPIFMIAMKTSLENHRTRKYFLMYAEKPRRWRKIIMSATFSGIREQSAISHVSATDYVEHGCKILPKALQKILSTLLPQLDLFDSVSSLSLSLRENESGQMIFDSRRIEMVEDVLEMEMSDEDQILQDIEDLGCVKFLESQITVKSRITSSYFRVWVETRECVERKAPFASAGKQSENKFQDFFKDLKLLNSLRGYAGVVQLIGVVLDETRLHLRSYLYESPAIMSLKRVLTFANSKSETIPWPIREIWSSQIIKAVSDIHSKGLIIGMLELGSVGLRADGTAILTRLQFSHRYLQNERGYMPPELRNTLNSDDAAQPKMLNFRTDVFQLGYILWLLAEHRSNVHGYLCAKSACTKVPRYMCSADHANPAELPPCCGGVPPYFSDIIKKCRSPNPRARPTARKLGEAVPYRTDFPPGMIELVDRYAPNVDYFLPYCDECGVLVSNLHYHCNVCCLGNFDLCPTCVAQGIHCFISEHPLMKRIMKNGRLVDES